MQRRAAVASSRFLDPAVLARIGDLELIARGVVEGFVSGLHRSPNLGLSTDFAEHRPYLPGDDIRRIDWRVFGRTDRLHLKEFEAETNTSVVFLLDVSRSMAYGSGPVTKLDYARMLAACLAYFSAGQRDRIGFGAVGEGLGDFIPPSTRHLPHLLLALDRLEPSGSAGLEAALRAAAERLGRRGIVVLLSDLYEEPALVGRALDHVRDRGHEVVVFHVLDPAETEFPFQSAASFRDMETGERLPVVPEYLRDGYREAIAAHLAGLERRLGASGVDYARFDTSRPLDHALYAYLAGRERRVRVR